MVSDKARQRITRLMRAHQEWLNKWHKRSGLFVEYTSPRGKSMNFSAYCFEVNKHMDKTIDKIAKIVKEESGILSEPEGKAKA
ncbi:hypothetical protein V0M98_34005 (plasmid) [Pseudomonas silesiensis]|uniref:hypothetical protein n=1 Tax=Pseudomonas silesiensis TaxID=1853130 RepID=UPI0030D5F1C9